MKEDHINVNQESKRKESLLFDSMWVAKNLPYIYFLIFLAMIYIGNAHYTEKKIRKIEQLKKENKEINWQYMSLKSDVIYQGTYTKLKETVKYRQLSNEGSWPKRISEKK
jgi:hypothetical protein